MNNNPLIFAILLLISSNLFSCSQVSETAPLVENDDPPATTPTVIAPTPENQTALARRVEGEERTQILNAVLDKRAELGLCSDSEILPENVEISNVYAREQGQYLVMMLCFRAAYQVNYEFVYVDASQKPMKMERPDMYIAGLPDFDPVTSILTNEYKYSGVGLCFQKSSYYWDGNALKLIALSIVDGPEEGCRNERSPGEEELITSKSVGLARLGMTLGQLKKLLPEDSQYKTTQLGVDLPGGIQVSFYSEARFSLGFDNVNPKTLKERPITDQSKITMIIVHSPQYRTLAGVGPGTPLKEAIAKYGPATLSYNTEAESRELVEFANQPFFKNGDSRVLFHTNQWTLTDFAGIYPESTDSYQQTQQYHDHGAIGTMWIMEQPVK